MENERVLIDDIKNTLDIVNVIGRTVTLTRQGNLFVGALNSNSKSGKSLKVDPIKQLWHDFPSGNGGDVFNWIAYNNNLDIQSNFVDILRIAAEEANIQFEGGVCGHSQETHEMTTFLTAVAEHYRTYMTDDLKSFIYNTWGIEYKTIDEMRIGYAPTEDSLLTTFGELFPPELIKSSGLMIKTRDGIKDFFQGRIMFPYWKNGKVVYFIGRKCDNTPDVEWENQKYKKQLIYSESKPYVSEVVTNRYLFGEDSVRFKDDYIVVSEGVTDCIMAIQKGIASVSPVTTNISKKQEDRLLSIVKRKKRVYICNDNEENDSGRKGAMRTADYLQRNGVYVQIIELPK